MDRELAKIIKTIQKHIHTKEWLEEIKIAFKKYWDYQHDKTLRNNRKIVNLYTKGMTDEFMRLKTYWEQREEKRHNKKLLSVKTANTLQKHRDNTKSI